MKITIGDLFTDAELIHASRLGNAKEICRQIVEPKMEYINRVTGQENNAMYFAYLVEYALSQSRKEKEY